MLPFLLLILFSTSVLAVDEICNQSETTFRNCLRVNLPKDALFFDYTDEERIAARATEWQATFDKCDIQNSNCYLQAQLIKITNDLIELANEKSLMNLKEPAYQECKEKILTEHGAKCMPSSYFDEYGFRVLSEKVPEALRICLADHAHKSKTCGRDFVTRYTREADIDSTLMNHVINLHSLGRYLKDYTD